MKRPIHWQVPFEASLPSRAMPLPSSGISPPSVSRIYQQVKVWAFGPVTILRPSRPQMLLPWNPPSPLRTMASKHLGQPHALSNPGHLGLLHLSIRGHKWTVDTVYNLLAVRFLFPNLNASFDTRLACCVSTCLTGRGFSGSEAGL